MVYLITERKILVNLMEILEIQMYNNLMVDEPWYWASCGMSGRLS